MRRDKRVRRYAPLRRACAHPVTDRDHAVVSETPGTRILAPYSTSAAIYDVMVGRYAFEHWKENFERLENRFGFDLSLAADVACGSGLVAAYLARRGGLVLACDLSPQMLREAAALKSRGVKCMRQDMRYVQPPERVTFLNCSTDALNHLLSEADIVRAFCSFHAALRAGGHALFDMNTAWQLREGSDTQAWEFEVEGQQMRWLSSWDEATMTSTLTLFFTDRGEGGGDLVEIHRERAYNPSWIHEELIRAGFTGVDIMDAAGLGKAGERTRRLVFVARA